MRCFSFEKDTFSRNDTENKNGISGGCGVYYYNYTDVLKNISEPFLIKPITNQRAELYAIYLAIQNISPNFEVNSITIYSDSTYCINTFTKWIDGWIKNSWKKSDNKPIKNKDIIKPLYYMMKKKYRNKIKFIYVKAHTRKTDILSIGNKKADQLALSASLVNKK